MARSTPTVETVAAGGYTHHATSPSSRVIAIPIPERHIMVTTVLVRRRDIAKTRIEESAPSPLSEGAVRLKVENFAVTANNVTYAAIGDAYGYWNFFPASPDEGIVPVWGHAVVEATAHPGLAVGDRLYGFLPMASHLDLLIGAVTDHMVSDVSLHRQPMNPFYNQYTRIAAGEHRDPAGEAASNLFLPLFRTSFLIAAMFRKAAWHGAEQLVVTSASSKTALALAHIVRAQSPEIVRTGLTSQGNLAFVQGTGLYDRVLAYEDAGQLALAPSVSVDFAGDSRVVGALRGHLGTALAYNCLVGATHVAALGQPAPTGLPGPDPIVFFAPDHATALIGEIGAAAFNARVDERWRSFVSDATGLIATEYRDGLAAAAEAFTATVQGSAKPDAGIIVRV